MDDIVSYQFAQVRQRRDERQEIQYELILRQQPKQSRMCGIGEKADRRPIDPPPIIQLKVYDASLPQSEKSSFLQNPYFFMYASLVAPDTDEELHLLRDGKTRSTTGSVVSSLYHLKDIDNSDAGFFVFPDLSVRMEGTYRLKLSLFEIIGREVYHCKSIFSDIFIVYSAKRFPGMEESTFLSRSFADQGLKIRIRRLAKRDRKELELIDQSISNRLKRQRPDGKRDDNESGDSSDVDMRDRTPNADDTRPKIAPDTARKDHISISPASPRRGPGPYEHIPPHMAHYDPSMYGPGYPPHRPLPWHDRPEYLPPEHYPPYYDPYDRRYGYHPYYYPHPPPLPDGTDHHRYPYPPPAYGRPPMYPGQPPYYDTPPRVGHPAGESPGAVRPYGYDPSSPYPPQRAPWPHYDYYASYAHPPPMVHPPPKPIDYATQETGDPQSKIPIQDLLSTEQQQQQQGQPQNQSQNQSQQNQQQNQQQSSTSQPNAEQNAAVPPHLHQQRMYGVPPSAFGLYPHPRPHEYMRHDMYRSPYDMVYPPHDPTVPQYGQNISPPVNKPQPTSQPPQASQGDAARTSLMPATPTPASSSSESVRQESRNVEYNSYNDSARRSAYPEREPLTSTTNPSSTSTSQAPSSYSGMPAIPTTTRTPVSLPPLSFMASPSGNSIPYHSATSTSSLLTSTSSSKSPQLKSPQPPQSSFDHSQSYSQSTSNSQRGTYGMNSGSDLGNGGNSSKNNGVNSNLGSGNEKPTLSTSPRAAAGFEGKYPLRRQGGDVEGERNVNESVGNNEKY